MNAKNDLGKNCFSKGQDKKELADTQCLIVFEYGQKNWFDQINFTK